MHSHSSRYLYVRAVYREVLEALASGETIPALLEIKAAECGINIDAIREGRS